MQKKGFTLVELLVVISIIGVLASLLLPAIAHILYLVQVTEVKTNITQLSMALKMYENDHGAYPPDGLNNDNTPSIEGIEGNVEGVFEAGKKSRYVDGALVRYLDGDIANDTNKQTSPTQYFEFKEEDLGTGTDQNHPTYISRFNTPFFYNELLSENRFGKNKDTANLAHPHHEFFAFRKFQIYNKIDQEENPDKWVTKY